MLCRWCLSYVSVMSWWCFGDVSVISRLCFVCVSWMIRWYLGDVSVILWWCVKMFSACASKVLVIFKWCVGDVSGVSRWCVVIALWCFGDMWVMPWFCVGDVSALCRWCCGVSVMGGDAAVIMMILWCFGDEYWWTFWDFQWVPKKRGWLFDVSLLLGSYAGLRRNLSVLSKVRERTIKSQFFQHSFNCISHTPFYKSVPCISIGRVPNLFSLLLDIEPSYKDLHSFVQNFPSENRWKRRFRTWKPSFSGSMLVFGVYFWCIGILWHIFSAKFGPLKLMSVQIGPLRITMVSHTKRSNLGGNKNHTLTANQTKKPIKSSMYRRFEWV